MNKHYILIFLFLCCCDFAKSQQIQVSEPVDITSEVDYKLIARYEDQVLLYRQTESKISIQSFFDGDLKENWTKEINFEKKDINTILIVPNKESFTILYYFQQRGNTCVRGKEFDTNAQEISDFNVATFEEPYYIKEGNLVSSQDKSHLLIYSINIDNELEVVNFDILQRKQHWHKKLQFPKINHNRDFQQILVNNSGETFVIYNQNNTLQKREQHQFVVQKITADCKKMAHLIPFTDYISYDVNIQYDEKNQKLVAAGLYSTKNTVANGIFYFNTDLKTVPTVQVSEFEETFMRSLTGNKKKKINGIQNFDICQLVLRKDGGVLLVAEQRFAYQSSGYYYPEERPKTESDYLYENILVASIHPSGKVYWKDVLHKSQSSENDNGRYSSFFALKTNSNIRFLYNNDISWDTSIFEYVVSGDGAIKRNVITHQEPKNGILPELSNGIQLSASEIITLSERDQKLRLMKINY